MLVYWSLLFLFALGSVLTGRAPAAEARLRPFLVFGFVIVVLLVGLRFKVGADWGNYADMFRFTGRAPIAAVLKLGEPGYMLLNRLVYRAGGEVWIVNLVCAMLFSAGMFAFVRQQRDPWLTATVAVPYLIIVVAMGYTRQSVAIGAVLAGLATLQRTGSLTLFALWVAAGSLFHLSVVIVIPIVALAMTRNWLLGLSLALLAAAITYRLFLVDMIDVYYFRYVTYRQQSTGAIVRGAMNMVPALLALLFARRLGFDKAERRVWTIFALAALAAFVFVVAVPDNNTGVDRAALYLVPLQLAVLGRAPALFRDERLGLAVVIAYCAAVEFVWLNFGTFSSYWVPYRMWPL